MEGRVRQFDDVAEVHLSNSDHDDGHNRCGRLPRHVRRRIMNETRPTIPLDLEVEEIETKWRPGCGTSSTSPRCTCYPGISTGESQD
jgi:hypothetical protein